MGKKTLIGIGVAIFLLGCVGVYNAITDFGQPAEERSDVETAGTIYDLEGEELKVRGIGTTIDSHFKLKYKFTANDGQEYLGYESIHRAQFNALREGDEVTVLYHSNNPNISAAKGFGTYMGVDQFPRTDPKKRLFGCAAIAAFGICVIIASFFCVEENGGSSGRLHRTENKFSDNPLEAMQQWKQEQLAQ